MKFKVGDKVRLTREAILKHPDKLNRSLVLGGELLEFNEGFAKISGSITKFQTHNLELVPEEPEFEYGEMIEVSCDEIQREKRTFLTKINGNAIFPYVCVADYSHDNFINGSVFDTRDRKYARKLRPQLTRKEIAEKFGVSEDFTLVD